jgi:hypothetical protein
MGMTGKFHTAWGDFHSLKNRAALEFECFTMLAMNAKCSIGDQLHPRGVMDEATYELIGKVYEQVAEKEAWCENATALTDIGLLSTEEFAFKETDEDTSQRTPVPMMGAIRMLQEGKQQFDILDSKSDFTSYKVLVLPDEIPIDQSLKAKLEDYVRQGGALIASYHSGLSPDHTDFASDIFGLQLKGEAPYSPDFLKLDGSGIGAGLPETELVMYQKGMEVATNDARPLLMANVPYFNRTWEHFSSHRHTPSAGKEGYPAVTQKGKVIYFMHPLFTQYAANAPRWCREVFLNAMNTLLPEPLIKTQGAPTSTIASINRQAHQSRLVLHLLNYIPERRGNDFDTVEDVLPVRGISLSLNVPDKISKVTLVPQGEVLNFRENGGRLAFDLPEIKGHQMVELKIS